MPKQRSLEDRFWSKVEKRGEDECWYWQGSLTNGYGTLTRRDENGKYIHMGAHRASYIIHYGEPQEGYDICHKCDHPNCVNPAHLWAGTAKDNTQDMLRKGRCHSQRGEACGRHKLKTEQIYEIWRLLKEGLTHREIAGRFGISDAYVSLLRHHKHWRNLQMPE